MKELLTVLIDKDLEDIIPEYFTSQKQKIFDLQNYLISKEFEKIEEFGHKIKGNGKSYGFEYLSKAGAKMEQAAKNNDSVLIEEWCNKIIEYLDNVNIIFVSDDQL